jgi:hypothetical protein
MEHITTRVDNKNSLAFVLCKKELEAIDVFSTKDSIIVIIITEAISTVEVA